MRRLVVVAIAGLVAWLSFGIQSAAVATSSSPTVVAYTCDGQPSPNPPQKSLSERGPPATTYAHPALRLAVDMSSCGSPCPQPGPAWPHNDYDLPAQFVHGDRARVSTQIGSRGSVVEVCLGPGSRCAAKPGTAIEKWAWPPNRGFLHDPVPTTLKPGTVIDRYGREGGTFVSPKGTPFRQRSLPPESASAPYRQYEVDGDHNYYVTEAQLLVHNCDLGASIAEHMGSRRLAGVHGSTDAYIESVIHGDAPLAEMRSIGQSGRAIWRDGRNIIIRDPTSAHGGTAFSKPSVDAAIRYFEEFE